MPFLDAYHMMGERSSVDLAGHLIALATSRMTWGCSAAGGFHDNLFMNNCFVLLEFKMPVQKVHL